MFAMIGGGFGSSSGPFASHNFPYMDPVVMRCLALRIGVKQVLYKILCIYLPLICI
jgi:hypothetical protein